MSSSRFDAFLKYSVGHQQPEPAHMMHSGRCPSVSLKGTRSPRSGEGRSPPPSISQLLGCLPVTMKDSAQKVADSSFDALRDFHVHGSS